MTKLLTGLAGLALVAVVATAGGDKAGTIDGTWIVTAASVGNTKAPDSYFAENMPSNVFKDGKYSQLAKGKVVESGTYKLDASKNPATIDFTIEVGEDKGKLQLGIYKLEGDTLTMAVSIPGAKARPKDFDPSDEVELQVFKRKK
jgi:uncharacterized protein (TIGR03067 family)